MKIKITLIILLIVLFSNIALADVPDNAACVIKHYKDYTNSLVSYYDAINQKLNDKHPQEYDILKPCNDVIIFDAKYAQSIVDKWWEGNPGFLFKYSKKLRNLGMHYDRNEVLKEKQKMCTSKQETVTKKQWANAFSIQQKISNDLNLLRERYYALEKLRWPNINCGED